METYSILEQLNKISCGNSSAKDNLIIIIIEQTTKIVVDLKKDLQTNNKNGLLKSVHKLKSTFIYLELTSANNLCEYILNNKSEDFIQSKKYIEELIAICSTLLNFLKSEKK